MTEKVVRHRGGVRDENNQLTPTIATTLLATHVAPGAGSRYVDTARDGEQTAFTVYFPLVADIASSDELTVRGHRYSIIVNRWQAGGRGGLEVLCTGGRG